MDAIKSALKTWFVTHWKTTVLGAVGAIEVYQQTHSVQLAATAFLAGLFMADGKAAPVATP